MKSIYELTINDTTGKQIDFSDYRGKVLLLANTATKCGLAGQFEELEALHKKFAKDGLVVIGFPCDQFLGQEPETNETVVGVCRLNFGVTFLLSEKINVNGPKTHPVFKFLKSHTRIGFGRRIKWNFTKFLVARDGETVSRFAPTTHPKDMETDIKRLLAATK
ncbi:glutathione peroxidase [bacterium]|nr:glutathione peroxidase [bacterium]